MSDPPRFARQIALVALVTGCWTESAPPRTTPVEPSRNAGSGSRPAPPSASSGCEVSLGPPVAATGLGTIRVELPDGEVLTRLTVASHADAGASVMSVQLGTALDGIVSVPPGAYVIEVDTRGGRTVRCTAVKVAAGGATTVTVRPEIGH